MDRSELIMELMDRYEWLPASIARYAIERNIDLDAAIRESGC